MSDYKRYSDLILLPSFRERYQYLRLNGVCCENEPEVRRWLHQYFYHTPEWKAIRTKVLLRDDGKDLGCDDRPIHGRLIVHHINPITMKDINDRSDKLFDLDNLITVSHLTHNAIHYGDDEFMANEFTERTQGDTTLW